MLMAALGDIRGNLPALEAVLRQIDAEGIQTVACTGEVAAGRPWANEVIDLLRVRGIDVAQGPMDRATALFARRGANVKGEFSDEERVAIAWAHEHCRAASVEFLRGLPRRKKLLVEGFAVCVCHGAPTSAAEILEEDAPLHKFQRQREAADAALFVCGGAPEPFSRFVDGALFVAPGRLDGPEETPGLARYAIIDTESTPWSVRFPSVVYSYSKAC